MVVELDRPQRAARDPLSRTRLAKPKAGADRAALQALLSARRSAVDAATNAQRQLRAMVITATESVRARFRGHRGTRAQTGLTAALRPRAGTGDAEEITVLTVLRDLARRIRTLEAEASGHEKTIRTVVASWRPDLLELCGIGPINAATVLSAWSHPGRCRDEAAFAMLGGVAPIPASSGRTVRFRLNRAGNRQLNRALHNIALSRQRYDQATRDYTDRRRAQGKTDREIRRRLKRYIARQLFRLLEPTPCQLDEPKSVLRGCGDGSGSVVVAAAAKRQLDDRSDLWGLCIRL